MRRAVAIIDGEHYPPVVRQALAELDAARRRGGARRRHREAPRRRGVRRAARALGRVRRPPAPAGRRDRPLRRAGARASRAARAREPRARARAPVRGRRTSASSRPRLVPVDLPSLARDRYRQAGGQDRRDGPRREAARDATAASRRRHGPGRPARARDRARSAHGRVAARAVPGGAARGVRPSRDGDRGRGADRRLPPLRRRPRRCGRASRTCSRASRSPRPWSRISSSSTGAAPRSPRSTPAAGSSSRRRAQPVEVAAGYLNAYRALLADLVVVTMAEPVAAHEALAEALRACARPATPVIRVVLRPRPLEPVAGERVAFFCTAPEPRHDVLGRHLAERYDAQVTHVSGSLSDRGRLRDELREVRRRRVRRRAEGGGRRRRGRGGARAAALGS